MNSKKIAIVTGAAGNLGQSVVKKLLASNFRVIGTVRSSEDALESEVHPDFEKYTLDVSDHSATEAFVHYIVSKYGKIHFSALLVGGFGMNKFDETSLDELHSMMKLNFETTFICSQAIFKQMKKQHVGGKILMVGAKPAIEPKASKGVTAYALAKSMVIKLAELINSEGDAYQIQASVIIPSIIDTPQNRDAMPDADFSKWVTPDQIAEVSLFIAQQPNTLLHDVIVKIYGKS